MKSQLQLKFYYYFSFNSLFSSYQANLLKENQLDEYKIINDIIIEPTITSTIVNNLKPFTNYTCIIMVINQGSEIINIQSIFELISTYDNSSFNIAQTFPSVPSKPERIAFYYVSYSHLNITWLKPNAENGIIIAYELWYENIQLNNLTNTAKTKIIRQEIETRNGSDMNYTLFINNLEPNINYKFKIRCRTQIDWGPFAEKIIKTGPQGKMAPLAPSKPMYTNLNETSFLLEWKSYSNNYDFFVIEINFVVIKNINEDNAKNISKISNRSAIFPDNFEFFAYSNTTSLVISKNDKRFNIKNTKYLTMCIFRVSSFNSISVSEMSPDSELIHMGKLFENSLFKEKNAYSPFRIASYTNINQTFYLNWWFLVIIALSSFTILIIIVLIMFLRGKYFFI